MRHAEDRSHDDLVTEELVAYEQRLAEGTVVDEPAEPATGVPLEVADRVLRAKACLDLLAALKPAWPERDSAIRLRVAFDAPIEGSTSRRRIGRYEIRAELGSGGFGIVYQAWDPRVERTVALKVPRPESLASPELQRRFEQEARAAAKLDHPHIVAVLEAGQANLLPYIASAYHEGETLAAWLKSHRQPIEPRTAARLVRKLADAVAHAHARGVLHRDIKPSNVLLVRGPGSLGEADLDGYSPRIMDFGLAKIAGAAGEMTQTGAVLGTIRYMSPEQAAGRTHDIGPGADIYGLGAVLYELLTGQPPFATESDLEVLLRIQTNEPTRIRRARASVPRDLETIGLKCLEKEPSRRFPSAQTLVEDLERFLQGLPIAARPSTPLEHFRKWVRRRPELAAFLGIAFASAIVVIALLARSNEKLSVAVEAAREYAYASDMRLAQESWESSMVAEARSLLEKYIPQPGERDLRRFEWHYLWNSMHDSTEVVARQPAPVWSLAVAPDQKTFATGDRGGIVRLWSLDSKRASLELKGHAQGDIDVVAFTPDGKLLASASNDGSIRLWNVASGECEKVLSAHKDWVGGMAISPDGQFLASGDGEGRVLLWDLPQGTLRGELYKQIGAVRWIVFHPLRPLIISACEGGDVRIWDYLENHGPPEAPEGRTESPLDPSWRNAMFDQDGSQLWAPNSSRLVRWNLQDTNNWKVIGQEYETDLTILAVAIMSRQKWIATAHDTDFIIALRNSRVPLRIEQLLRGHTDRVRCLSVLGAADQLLSGSEDGTVCRWQVGLSDVAMSRVPLPDEANIVAWSPRGDAVAVGMRSGQLAVIQDLEQPNATLIGGMPRRINALACSSNGQHIYAADIEGHVHCFAVATGVLTSQFQAQAEIHRMALSPADEWLAYAEEKDLFLVDPATGHEHWRFHHPQHVWGIEFLNPTELVTCCTDGYVRCFDVRTGQVKRQTEKQRHDVRSFDLSTSGKLLVTGSTEKTIRVFDAQTFEELHRFTQSGGVGRVYFIDDDRRLLACVEHRLVVLDPVTGQTVLKLPQLFEDGPSSLNRAGSMLAAPVGKTLMLWRIQDRAQQPARQ